MNHQKRNWMMGLAIAVAAVIIIFMVYWYSRSGADSAGKDKVPDTNGAEMNQIGAGADGGTSEEKEDSDTQDNLADYLEEQDLIMSKMMQEMEAVEKTGNASVHFLKGMTPHHQSAIDMAQSYLKYGGQNEELKQLATDIISAQTGEIEEMAALLKRIEESGAADGEKEEGYLKEYNKMMASHQHGSHSQHGTYADVEEAFAEGMIMHHQMAIDMSEAILTYTDEEDVKILAQSIIDAQKKEIKQMQGLTAGA